jgi:Transglutaminase-like superfamily
MEIEPITLTGKARLAAEVLRSYPPALRDLRTNDLTHMVQAARGVRHGPPGIPPGLERPLAIRLGRAVTLTLKLLPTDHRCLIQSLVLTRMLARRSLESAIVIGVQTGEEFSAHAWVEYEGLPVLPPRNHHRLHEL